MNKKSLTDTKLIILSLAKLRTGETADKLKALAVSSLYTDFFEASEALAILLEEGLLSESVRQQETVKDVNGHLVARIDLTEKGEAVLDTLRHTLPQPIIIYLQQFVEKQNKEEEVKADYQPDLQSGWRLTLQHSNGRHDVVRIELQVPNESTARKFAKAWAEHYEDIYHQLISDLSN